MTVEQLILLAVVQGTTAFLPIDSATLAPLLPAGVAGAPGPAIALAVHAGSLGAVLLYLWRDVARMLAGIGRALCGRRDPGARLALQLALATLPLLAAGYLMSQMAGAPLWSIEAAGWATIGFGVLLGLTDRLGMTLRRIEHLRHGGAAIIGLMQVLALVPGAGRPCMAMIAARLLGYERTEAARLALLLGIPALAVAAALAGIDLRDTGGDVRLPAAALFTATAALVAALAAIALMMRWLRRGTFLPFALCRILLGAGLLAWHYQG